MVGAFVQEITAYPTVIFTLLLVIVLFWWLLTLVGMLDIDILGGGDGADGGADGGADAGSDAGDAGDAGDGHAGHAHGSASLMSVLGLRKVPLTVSISLLSLFGWIIVFSTMHFIGPQGALISALVAVGGVVGSVVLTSLCIRPLIPLFQLDVAPSRVDYIGEVFSVETGRVDSKFGRAISDTSGMIVEVRYEDGTLARGAKVLLVDYDGDANTYLVEPMEPLLLEESSGTS